MYWKTQLKALNFFLNLKGTIQVKLKGGIV